MSKQGGIHEISGNTNKRLKTQTNRTPKGLISLGTELLTAIQRNMKNEAMKNEE